MAILQNISPDAPALFFGVFCAPAAACPTITGGESVRTLISSILQRRAILPKLSATPKYGRPPYPSASATPIEPGDHLIAQLIEIESLPGVFRKTLQIPPSHIAVRYGGSVPLAEVKPPKCTFWRLGPRHPTLVALIDTTDFLLEACKLNLETADGHKVDWVFQVRLCVADPLRFANRVLDSQPQLDRDSLANLIVAKLSSDIGAEAIHYEAHVLLEMQQASTSFARRLRPQIDEFCSDAGLQELEFRSIRFERSRANVEEMDALTILAGERGKVEVQKQLQADASADGAETLLRKTGLSDWLSEKSLEQIRASFSKPGGQNAGVDLIVQAVERRLAETEARLKDQFEQDYLREGYRTKLDKFADENKPVLLWSVRLKQLGALGTLLAAAFSFMAIFYPDLGGVGNTIKIVGAVLSLLGAIGAFLGSWRLGLSYKERRSDWLAADPILKEESVLRARIANELGKNGDVLVGLIGEGDEQSTRFFIRLRETERKTRALQRDIGDAETGFWILAHRERILCEQADGLRSLGYGLLRQTTDLGNCAELVSKGVTSRDWAAAQEALTAFEKILMDMDREFGSREGILRLGGERQRGWLDLGLWQLRNRSSDAIWSLRRIAAPRRRVITPVESGRYPSILVRLSYRVRNRSSDAVWRSRVLVHDARQHPGRSLLMLVIVALSFAITFSVWGLLVDPGATRDRAVAWTCSTVGPLPAPVEQWLASNLCPGRIALEPTPTVAPVVAPATTETPTATSTPHPTATQTPRPATATPSPTLTPVRTYLAPDVQTPENRSKFTLYDQIVFRWSFVPLRPLDLYRVQVSRDPEFQAIACAFSTDMNQVLLKPSERCNDNWQFNNRFFWRVQVIAPDGRGDYAVISPDPGPIYEFNWTP
jgi:hypothetical protein